MSQDEEQLRLLSVFHYVVAGLMALFACIPLIHLAIGLMMLIHPQPFGPHEQQPPAVFRWIVPVTFVIFPTAFILAGWAMAASMAWAGRCLQRRRRYTFCLVMACIACVFFPFGTVLGVFTIIVLVRPTVKALFIQPTAVAR